MSGAKDLHQLGVAALAKALAGREVSAVEAVAALPVVAA